MWVESPSFLRTPRELGRPQASGRDAGYAYAKTLGKSIAGVPGRTRLAVPVLSLWIILAITAGVKAFLLPGQHSVYPNFPLAARHWWADEISTEPTPTGPTPVRTVFGTARRSPWRRLRRDDVRWSGRDGLGVR